MAEPVRALIVDDHPIVVDALVASLTSLGTLDEVDQERSLGAALDRLASGARYQIIILDLNLDDVRGPETLIRFREAYPDLPVAVFSGDETETTMEIAYEHGVNGYIPKSFAMPVIVNAIRTVLMGGAYLPPKFAESLGLKIPHSSPAQLDQSSPAENLSPRQSEVFRYLLQGLPNKVIGSRLGMAEGTVKTHLNTIYRMFGVNSRAKMILRARDLRLI